MAKTIEKTGKSVEDALQVALSELGLSESEVDVEVLEMPSKGIFGFFGNKPARIKVTVKEVEVPAPEVVPEEPVEKVVIEPPTVVKFRVVPSLDTLPKVDAEFVEEKPSDDIEKSAVGNEPAPTVEETPKVDNEPVEDKESCEREQIIERAKKFLTDIYKAVDIDLTINVREVDGNIFLDLAEKDSAMIIGKHGQTIDALQYLTNLAANRSTEEKIRFILDVGNYRERREETIIKLAKSVADRVVRMRQDIKMEPMSRHERRIVHTTLQENKRVETHSYGEEPYRYVVVSLKRKGK
ncbi:MAG: protein jag [Selenomonadaceae bacterium]|nr:protein jag [Selenomonadaceae bacterium]